jgi:EAL domain-containing protein (putative c-di-GMP-specific phosphodiesterase class I)
VLTRVAQSQVSALVRPRLPRFLPSLLWLTLAFTTFELAAGVAMNEPALVIAALITAPFAVVVLAARRLVQLRREVLATVLIAVSLGFLGIAGAYLIGNVAQAMLLLPVLSVSLLLPYATRRFAAAALVFGLTSSALTFVALELSNPVRIGHPLDAIYSASILIGIAALVIAALLDFAGAARKSLADLTGIYLQAQALSVERAATVELLNSLEARSDPELTAAAVARALAELPGVILAGVLEHEDGRLRVLGVSGPGTFSIPVGGYLPNATSESILAHATGGPWSENIPDAASSIDVARPSPLDAMVVGLGIRAFAFAPMRIGRELIGIIGVGTIDAECAWHLTDELPAIGEFGATASALLAPSLTDRRGRRTDRGRIAAVISERAFRPVFQPIVDLATDRTVGFEALTEFRGGLPTYATFELATRVGLGQELELATLAAAIKASTALPRDAWLILNVSPRLVTDSDRLPELLGKVHRSIVLEITEHEVITDYVGLRSAFRRLGPDVLLAVDDAGAGVANFNHLVELRPAMIKIDLQLVRDVDTDLARQALVAGLVHFGRVARAQVLVEGVETKAELATVVQLGVTLAQGYLLGRPNRARAWATAAGPTAIDRVLIPMPARRAVS